MRALRLYPNTGVAYGHQRTTTRSHKTCTAALIDIDIVLRGRSGSNARFAMLALRTRPVGDGRKTTKKTSKVCKQKSGLQCRPRTLISHSGTGNLSIAKLSCRMHRCLQVYTVRGLGATSYWQFRWERTMSDATSARPSYLQQLLRWKHVLARQLCHSMCFVYVLCTFCQDAGVEADTLFRSTRGSTPTPEGAATSQPAW